MRGWIVWVAIAALTVSVGASAKIYKWTDEDGNIHYTQQPPQNGQTAEELDVRTGRSSTPNQRNGAPSEQQQPQETAAPDEEPAEEEKDPQEVVKENCKLARQNLDLLQAGGSNRRFRKPNGEVVRYTQEQIEAKIKQNQQFIENYCQDGNRGS